MEYEIDDCDALFDASTNPSLARRRRARARPSRGSPARFHQRAVLIPEEEDQLV